MELSRRSFLKRGLILGTTPVAAGLASTAAMAASLSLIHISEPTRPG